MPHTPGPWQVKSEINPWEVIANIDGPDDGRFHYDSICDCDQPARSRMESEESMANARLIAATPDMLEALLVILKSAVPHPTEHPTMTKAWEIGRAAVAKATGEPYAD